MTHRPGLVAVLATTVLALTACGAATTTIATTPSAATAGSSSPSSSPFTCPDGTVVDFYDPAQRCPDNEPSDPVVTPEPTDVEFTTSPYGSTRSFQQGEDEANTFTVRVGPPVKAVCQYDYIGCEKPETGDRVVTVTVTVKNTGSQTVKVSQSEFVLEFADGTRMEADDGAASDYSPDNAMDYETKVRPKGTYTSTLTFEAPKGPFTVILLTASYDGEDLHGWA